MPQEDFVLEDLATSAGTAEILATTWDAEAEQLLVDVVMQFSAEDAASRAALADNLDKCARR